MDGSRLKALLGGFMLLSGMLVGGKDLLLNGDASTKEKKEMEAGEEKEKGRSLEKPSTVEEDAESIYRDPWALDSQNAIFVASGAITGYAAGNT